MYQKLNIGKKRLPHFTVYLAKMGEVSVPTSWGLMAALGAYRVVVPESMWTPRPLLEGAAQDSFTSCGSSTVSEGTRPTKWRGTTFIITSLGNAA